MLLITYISVYRNIILLAPLNTIIDAQSNNFNVMKLIHFKRMEGNIPRLLQIGLFQARKSVVLRSSLCNWDGALQLMYDFRMPDWVVAFFLKSARRGGNEAY